MTTTGVAAPTSSPTLIYDADCGFCTVTARWLVARGNAQAVPAQALDLSTENRARAAVAAGWLVDGEISAWGAPAIANSLVSRGGLPGLVGRTMRWPVMRLAADLVYRWVAANRQRMPGATDSCRLPTAEPRRRNWRAPLAFLLVTLTWVALLSVKTSAGEPYPALIQPAFGSVPESDGRVVSPEVHLTAVLADGARVPVSFREFFPRTLVQVDPVAMRAFYDPTRNQDPRTAAWVLSRLHRLDLPGEPVALSVRWRAVEYRTDAAGRRILGGDRTTTIDLTSGVS